MTEEYELSLDDVLERGRTSWLANLRERDYPEAEDEFDAMDENDLEDDDLTELPGEDSKESL